MMDKMPKVVRKSVGNIMTALSIFHMWSNKTQKSEKVAGFLFDKLE